MLRLICKSDDPLPAVLTRSPSFNTSLLHHESRAQLYFLQFSDILSHSQHDGNYLSTFYTHNQYMIELFPNAFVDHGANRIHWLQNTLDSS
jgi:hypothetical protein